MKTPQNHITVTAHSGSMGLPDNSIDAARAGVEAGAEIVEIDLSFLESGDPVLSHDQPKAEENPLPLSALFEFLAGHPGVRANVDVKSTEKLESVAPLAREYGVLPQIFFTGIGDDFVDAAREKSPEIPRYLNVSLDQARAEEGEYLDSLVARVRASGGVGINCNYHGVTSALVETFRRAGLLVSLWTVNEPEDMERVIALRPDNITTRRPDLLVPLLRRCANLEKL